MALTKATQNVILDNICTTDTTQVVSGSKTFSSIINGSVAGSADHLSSTKSIGISGDVIGAQTIFNGTTDVTIVTSMASGVSLSSPNIYNPVIANPAISGGTIASPSITGATLTSPSITSPSISSPTITSGFFNGIATGSIISKVIQGVADGSTAAVGYVGEIISSLIDVTNAVSLVTATSKTVTSITLPAGDWVIDAQVDYRAGATTNITVLTQGVSQVANTIGSQDTFSRQVFLGAPGIIPTAAYDPCMPIKSQRLSLAATATIYLVANAVFTVSTLAAYGSIEATRVR